MDLSRSPFTFHVLNRLSESYMKKALFEKYTYRSRKDATDTNNEENVEDSRTQNCSDTDVAFCDEDAYTGNKRLGRPEFEWLRDCSL